MATLNIVYHYISICQTFHTTNNKYNVFKSFPVSIRCYKSRVSILIWHSNITTLNWLWIVVMIRMRHDVWISLENILGMHVLVLGLINQIMLTEQWIVGMMDVNILRFEILVRVVMVNGYWWLWFLLLSQKCIKTNKIIISCIFCRASCFCKSSKLILLSYLAIR